MVFLDQESVSRTVLFRKNTEQKTLGGWRLAKKTSSKEELPIAIALPGFLPIRIKEHQNKETFGGRRVPTNPLHY
mgnify:CR=1 FL=1